MTKTMLSVMLVLPGLPGSPMRPLVAGDGSGLPDAAELERVLDTLLPALADVRTAGRRMTGGWWMLSRLHCWKFTQLFMRWTCLVRLTRFWWRRCSRQRPIP